MDDSLDFATVVLVLQPRWLKGEDLCGHLSLVAARYPMARMIIMTAAPEDIEQILPTKETAVWSLPDLRISPRREVREALRRVRSKNFDAAVLLLNPHDLTRGGYDLQLWATVARAQLRHYSDGTIFSVASAAHNIAHRIMQNGLQNVKNHTGRRFWNQSVLRIAHNAGPVSLLSDPHTFKCRRRLWTHLYLLYFTQFFGASPGKSRGIIMVTDTEFFDAALACEQGWIMKANSDKCDLFVAGHLDDVRTSLLAHDGVVLLPAVDSGVADIAHAAGWTVLYKQESFAKSDQWDLWLSRC